MLHVEGCTINDFSGYGIDVEPSSTSSKLLVDDSIVRGNGFTAVVNSAYPNLLIENTEASYNVGNGVAAVGPFAPPSLVVRISNMVLTGNGAGLATSGNAVINSFGNNKNDGNTTNGSPNNTISQQ